MSERNVKKAPKESAFIPLLNVLSISPLKLIFFSTWGVLIMLSIFPWQFTVIAAVTTGFIGGREKMKGLALSVASLILGWGFMLLYFTVKSHGKTVQLAKDMSIILFGNVLMTPFILVAPLIVASIIGFSGGLVGLYSRNLLEIRTTRNK